MVKCANCRHCVKVTVEFPAKIPLEPKTFRCSYSHETMDISELNNDRKCKGYERL